jgi:hypothetical protein
VADANHHCESRGIGPGQRNSHPEGGVADQNAPSWTRRRGSAQAVAAPQA